MAARIRATIILATIAFTGANVVHAESERPVARVGKRVIHHWEINCEITTQDLQALAAKEQREPDEVCREREQQRLDFLITEELHAHGAAKLGIDVSDEDLERDAAFHRYGEEKYARLSEHYRGLARAVLLVYHGEPAAAVYRRDIEPMKAMSEDEFRRFVGMLRSAEGAERFIERHTPDYFRTTTIAGARRRIARDKLMQHLTKEAARRGMSFATHVETFWRELTAEIGLEILDPRYQQISLKGLSWSSEPANMP